MKQKVLLILLQTMILFCSNAKAAKSDVITSNTAGATLSFSSSGTYEWEYYGGKLRSTNYQINSSTSQTTITIGCSGSCSFSFDYAVSSESSFDKLTITLDGNTLVNAISGTVSNTYEGTLNSGSHTLVLKYVKDGSVSNGDDRAYVSNMKFESDETFDPFASYDNLSDFKAYGIIEGSRLYYTYDKNNTLTILGNGAWGPSGQNTPRIFKDIEKEVKKIVVSEGVTTIGDWAFPGFVNAEEVVLPNSIISIGAYAFADGYSFKRVNLPNSLKSIGDYAFGNWIIVEHIDLPNSLQTIGKSAFYRCFYLESISIPNSVTSIGDEAFWACRSLKNVSLGTGIKTIPYLAFEHCSDLTSLVIPSNITSIVGSAFNDCPRLFEIYNLSTLNIVAGDSNYGQVGQYAKVVNKSMSTPTSIRSQDGFWFGVANGVNYLLGYDYSHYKDASIVLPESYNGQSYVVNDYAFFDFSEATSVTIPKNVTSIGRFAFNLSKLTTATCYAKVPPVCAEYAFRSSSCERSTLYVPSASVEDYKNANEWKNFGTILIDPNETEVCYIEYTTTDGMPIALNTSSTSIFKDADGNKIVPISNTYENGVGRLSFSSHVACLGDGFAGTWQNTSTLETITLPDCVQEMNNNTFNYCRNLTAVYISNLESWCNITFNSGSCNPMCYAKHLYVNGEEVTDIVIPDNVNSIKNYTFYGLNNLKTVQMHEGITSIGQYAFYYCEELESINIPNSVASIGVYAFDNCYKLTSVSISSLEAWCGITFGVTYGSSYANPLNYADHLYLNGKEVKDLVIPNGVTELKEYVFYGFKGLTSVQIPESVTSIGSYAFYRCENLENAVIPSSVTRIEPYTFEYCLALTTITLPSTMSYIGGSAFASTNLSSFRIPNGISKIESGTFRDCKNLQSISIPSSVTTIGDYAFNGCTSLASLNIPEGVQTIYSNAFTNCEGLKNLYISSSVSDIYGGSFLGCGALESIVVSPDNQVYDSRDNCNAIIKKDRNSLLLGCKNTIIPDGIVEIYAQAFAGCTGLTSIWIPEGVTVIAPAAFIQCSNLKSISLPSTLATIFTHVFAGCVSLESINCNAVTPPKFYVDGGDYSFIFAEVDKSKCTVYVPIGCVNAYKTAPVWVDFPNIAEYIPTINLVDGENYTNSQSTNCESLTFTKTFSESSVGNWNALYVPMSINVEEYAGELDFAKIYAFCATIDTNGDGMVDADDENFLFVRPVKSGNIKANVPYLIRPHEAKTYTINSADNILHKATEGKVEFSTTEDKYTVTGLNAAFTVTAGDNNYYISTTGNLNYRTSGSTTVKANRWIMHKESTEYGVESGDVNNVKSFRIFTIGEDMDEETAIRMIKGSNPNNINDDNTYTLNGNKMNTSSQNLQKGIYIKNGKKFIVK